MKRRMVTLLVLFVLLAPGMAPALKTNQVEFGKDGAYDGHVTISRDVSGNMVFKDDSLTSPIELATIAHGVRNHGELTGLGSDDHTHYLNTSRHGTVHTAAFNNNLPIGPDVINNTTIGQHVQDSDIHISRSLGEMIVGPWKFDVLQEFRGDIKLSQHGLPGKMDIYFEDGESDAHLRWNKLYNRFEFNRMLYTPEANFDSATATTLRIGENLYGNRPNYPPSGRISNFVSIEGIASENLLDKSADEDISGKWDFLNDVYIDGDLVTSGTITSLGGIKGLSKKNVITVAKKGGDYETIQAAMDAATAGTTILIYPGVYDETVTFDGGVNPINLIGIDRDLCIITRSFAQTGAASFGDGTLNWKNNYYNCTIANLTIRNTGAAPYATIAVWIESGTQSFDNCIFWGNGRDVVTCAGSTNSYFKNCKIYTVSTAHAVWIYNGANEFRDCIIFADISPVVQFTNAQYTKSGTFLNCWMRGNGSLFDCDSNPTTLTVDNIYCDGAGAVLMTTDQNATIKIGRVVGATINATSYTSLTEYVTILDVKNSLKIAGTERISSAGVFTGTNSNWDAAYGWGNHASAGYLTAAITSLNGLTASTQTFATPGTTGTAPAWSSATTVHTLNIPMASASSVTAGLISKTDYDTFNAKQTAGNYATLAGAETLTNKNYDITETMTSDHTAEGRRETKTAGENLIFGDIVYFKSDGKIWKADADNSSTAPGLGMALETITSGNTGKILRWGTVRDDTWAWTIGGIIYLSTDAGGMTQTQPTGTDDVIQILGICHPNADTIDFNPSIDYATHN